MNRFKHLHHRLLHLHHHLLLLVHLGNHLLLLAHPLSALVILNRARSLQPFRHLAQSNLLALISSLLPLDLDWTHLSHLWQSVVQNALLSLLVNGGRSNLLLRASLLYRSPSLSKSMWMRMMTNLRTNLMMAMMMSLHLKHPLTSCV